MVKSILIKSKNAQVWSLDIVVAIVIFVIGIVLLYVYAINYLSRSDEKLENLFYEGNLAAGLILSDDTFGILSDGKINQTKLDDFSTSYSEKKSSIGVTKDFYFELEGLELNGLPATYVGKINNSQIEDFIQITRITVYNNKPTKFQLYIWK